MYDITQAGAALGGSILTTKDAWSDGAIAIDDFAAPAFAGLEALGAFIDPVNWLVGGLLDPIYNWIFDHLEPLKAAIESITGSPEKVESAAAALQGTAREVADSANQLVDHVNGILSQWEGQARDAFRTAMAAAVEMQRDVADKLHQFASVYYAVASVISALKEIVVSLIKMFVTDLITKGLLAAAASIPSLGSAIAAYMAWAAAKYAVVAGKISKLFARAAGKLANVAGEATKIGQFFASIASRLTSMSSHYDDLAAQLDGLRSGNHSDMHHNVPRAERGEDRWRQKAAERAEAGNKSGAERAERKADRFAEDGDRAWDRIRERSKDMRTQGRDAAPGGWGTETTKAASKGYGDAQRRPGDSTGQRDDLRNPADGIGTLDE